MNCMVVSPEIASFSVTIAIVGGLAILLLVNEFNDHAKRPTDGLLSPSLLASVIPLGVVSIYLIGVDLIDIVS